MKIIELGNIDLQIRCPKCRTLLEISTEELQEKNDLNLIEQELKKNEWRPIQEYFNEKNHDWVLVQFEENNSSHFRGLPNLCEFRKNGRFGDVWTYQYLNKECKAVAFFEWRTFSL